MWRFIFLFTQICTHLFIFHKYLLCHNHSPTMDSTHCQNLWKLIFQLLSLVYSIQVLTFIISCFHQVKMFQRSQTPIYILNKKFSNVLHITYFIMWSTCTLMQKKFLRITIVESCKLIYVKTFVLNQHPWIMHINVCKDF